ncbi:hypothetical protein [Loigolactobacillus jiayinensis]|mgnify:CR=1 FL=1|uniref:Uncharacterized protein n=1 Tax=Loigolactobacillus jiayinensis TaxID=2486016 RepID=A0ABW1RHJ1_9LACO|nr:hypothetical protein [Loigolactobacillus jiayinensis]
MNKTEVQKRLNRELFTVAGKFDIAIDDRLYTETEFQNLKQTLLTLNQMGMTSTQLQQITALNA